MAQINLDTAQRLDITCRKGDTFELDIDFTQTIPAANTWLMHVRETDTSEGEDNILIPVGDIVFTVDDGDGTGVTITDSKLTVTIPAVNMADVDSGMFVYDIQNTNNSIVKTYVYGIFKVNEDITV
jgi:hypothetical protein